MVELADRAVDCLVPRGTLNVQASSMLMLMTLGAGHGDEVTLRAEGEGAEESVNALADLLEKDLVAEE